MLRRGYRFAKSAGKNNGDLPEIRVIYVVIRKNGEEVSVLGAYANKEEAEMKAGFGHPCFHNVTVQECNLYEFED